jgi:hypothetical protein
MTQEEKRSQSRTSALKKITIKNFSTEKITIKNFSTEKDHNQELQH